MSRAGSLVAARITQAPVCTVINLTEEEKNIYKGAGGMLARFENGMLAQLFDPAAAVLYQNDTQKLIAATIKATRQWLEDAEFDGSAATEIWFVNCSCYQLCQPLRIFSRDARAMAFLAGQISDACNDFSNG